ncbi:MAG: OmpA family protein [Flavobacteriales bacterium]|nr:OmpA family protein [Flavobacteriales bacterium]
MKKNLTVLFLMLTLVSFGQDDYNKWSAGLSFGAHDGMHPTIKRTRLFQIHHIGANGRYMMNSKIGVMLDVGYDYIDTYSSSLNTNYWRTSVQGVVNLGNLLCFDTWTKRIGLLIHGGTGVSHLWVKKDLRAENPADKLFKGIDDMLNYTFGATAQFMITDQISLNADLSFTFHSRQSMEWDWSKTNGIKSSIDGYIINTSIGASYYFGKNKKHADWSPSSCMAAAPKAEVVDNSKYDAYEARIKDLEERLANQATISDRDGDGIADEHDLCPDVAGLYSDNGCADTDGDGVDDLQDKCPDVAGVRSNDGCPAVDKDVEKVMAAALKGVQFESGKAVLLKRSSTVLNNVVEVMKDNPTYYLNVFGYTDSQGDDAENLLLSKERAAAVTAYLTQKGVEASRLHANGFGEAGPKASNETAAGRALNRRVEFKVVFE